VIPAISRGGRMRGLLRYLVSEGKRNEHTDPHVVAGSDVELWRGVALDAWHADRIAERLDAVRRMTGAGVTVRRKDDHGNVLVAEDGTPKRADAHVWHCSLSLSPEEGLLSDERWQQLAEQFLQRMKLADHDWVAIRHGVTKNRGDHIHLVVQLVGKDGKPANVHNDHPRAQKICGELEREHGLRIVEGRSAKRGVRATDHRQAERAAREYKREQTASPVPDRDQLEAAVRVAAGAASSEAEFIRLLRADGLLVRPRFAAERADEVVGYSVALAPTPGRDPVWHAGGKVAKDLTLPRLRSDGGWTAQDAEAIEEWQRAFHGQPAARPPAPAGDPDVQRAVAELRAVRDAAEHDPAVAARTGAACFYGWAQLEPELAPRLALCAVELSRSAQTRAAGSRPARSRAPSLPLLAAALVNPSNKTLWRLALLQEMMALSSAVAAAHNAAGELERAERLLAQVRGQLEPLRVGFEDAHAAVDPEYARQLQSYRAAQEARRLNEIATGGVPPQPGRTAAAAHPRPPDRRPPTQRRR
jgi:hypothetical protein